MSKGALQEMLTDFAGGGTSVPAGHGEAFELLLDQPRRKPDWQLLTPEALKEATNYAGLDRASLADGDVPINEDLPDKDMVLASLFDALPETELAGEDSEVGDQTDEDGLAGSRISDMEERHAADVAALKAEHDEELTRLKVCHQEEIAALIASRLQEIEAHVAAEAERHLISVLQPILSDAVAHESIAALAAELKALLLRGSIRRVLAHGPRSLYDQLVLSMGETDLEIGHVESDAVDLTVEVDHKILATRLSQWASSVSECLA